MSELRGWRRRVNRHPWLVVLLGTAVLAGIVAA